MKGRIKIYTLIFALIVFVQCHKSNQPDNSYAIAIHGGTYSNPDTLTQEEQELHKKSLERILLIGDSILKSGATSIDAVEYVITLLENNSLFNAGKGAVYTHEGIVELDASIMNGANLNAGAVSGLRDVKNPIVAARKVMEQSRHVMLSGKGASEFAKLQGLEIVNNSYFHTLKSEKLLQELLNNQRKVNKDDKHGTVGCVALDKYGNISAGTSTGGMNNKRFGRIGDSPIIGAGTYANNNTCGISCTGWGEYYIRLGFSRDISAMIEYKNMPIDEACREEIRKLSELGGFGGVIGVDNNGDIGICFNTKAMFRAYKKSDGTQKIQIYNE